jgi:hypothetical protein
MRLPLPFSISLRSTARGLVYIISWLGPSNVLPLPIAQLVFPFEQAARAVSVLEVGGKTLDLGVKVVKKAGQVAQQEILHRPFPTVMSRQRRDFHYKMTKRLREGNTYVGLDEALNSGMVQLEVVQDAGLITFDQEKGVLQITVTTQVVDPSPVIAQRYQRTTRKGEHLSMQVVGYPQNGIQASRTYEIGLDDFFTFLNDVVQHASGTLPSMVITDSCQGIPLEQFKRHFPRDPDPGSGSGAAGGSHLVTNPIIICDEQNLDFLRNKSLKQATYSKNIAVEPSLPVFGKISAPLQIFTAYVCIGLPLAYSMSKLIQKLLEKYSDKNNSLD